MYQSNNQSCRPVIRQFLTEQELNALLSLYSKRDLPMATRQAVRLRIIHGHTYEFAEFCSGVSRRSIYNAIQKLYQAHQIIEKAYRGGA